MKDERKSILIKLMHKQSMTFNELWGKQGESNAFAYHLKVLEEDGLVCKGEKGYSLTHEGKKSAAYIDGETGNTAKFPLVAVIIAVKHPEKDAYLMNYRTKEPFYGYWGFHGGKLKFDQFILECAAEELKQETGLSCSLQPKGIMSIKTYGDGKLSYNHQLVIVRGTSPKGRLVKRTREGENKWVLAKEISELKTFPDIPAIIDIVKGKSFAWVETERTLENDEFKRLGSLRRLKI